MYRSTAITLLMCLVGLCALAKDASAQTTAFTYQGSLKDGASAANGNYDFEFALFDALGGGTQLGTTQTQTAVVTNGIFAVNLDFGSQFPGANRFLEIRVRLSGQPGFTTLAPRQEVNSAPYSVKTLNADNATNAANATNATTANNALNLGGVAAGQYVLTGDARLSDARNPLPNSGNYIQNQSAAPQAASNFNISGNGRVGGKLYAGNGVDSRVSDGDAVYGESPARGVYGFSPGSYGVEGSSNSGFGVVGSSESGTGVVGSSVSGYAGSFLGKLRVFPNPTIGGPSVEIGTPGGEIGLGIFNTNRADIRFDGTTLKLLAGLGVGAMPVTNGIAITTAGDVRIGTLNPNGGAKLEVYNSVSLGNAVRGYSESGYGVVGSSNTAAGVVGFSNTGFAGEFFGRVHVSTNLGIGTSSPERLLHVNGRARIGNIPSEASVATVCFNAVGDLLNCASTLRLKTNVQPFLGGLDMVRLLRPITFDWKDGSGHAIGLGAEDVAKIEPYLTFAGSKGEINGVKYDSVSVVLINAVKEQQAQIEAQKAVIDIQQQEIYQLKKSDAVIEALKKLVCQAHSEAEVCK